MRNVYVIGVGMFRFGKYLERTMKDMAAECVDLVLKDADIGKDALQFAYVSNGYWGLFEGQHSIKGQVLLFPLGIQKIPITNVENACAGASTAFHLAWMSIASGLYDVGLALGVEKLANADKELSLKSFMSSMDVLNFANQVDGMLSAVRDLTVQPPPEQAEAGQGRSIFMDMYAVGARWHMSKYGSTQRQLAIISSKNHWHSTFNPLAQIQKDFTVEEVLADKLVSYPLTRPMCAPIGDGATAAILCSDEFLKKLPNARPVKIRASVLGSGTDRGLDGEDIGARLSKKAYEIAGIGPEDIDVAEVHDATAYGELHQTEVLGFCPEGEGGIFAEQGTTKLGGKLPINTSGGLESRGHPIGASGMAQIHEIVTQLRGEAGKRQAEGVRLGLTENGGGTLGFEEASMTIHILETVK
jgi:acetyl-CoA acetyltransferase